MSTRLTWKTRLAPFADEYSAMLAAVERIVESMTDDELTKVLAATRRPSQTNCWWAIYRVAPIVREAVLEERYSRQKTRAGARRAAKFTQAVTADGRD